MAAALLLAALVPKGDPDIGIFVTVTLAGFAIGVVGHVVRMPALVIAGIVLVLLGTLVLPLLAFPSGTE